MKHAARDFETIVHRLNRLEVVRLWTMMVVLGLVILAGLIRWSYQGAAPGLMHGRRIHPLPEELGGRTAIELRDMKKEAEECSENSSRP